MEKLDITTFTNALKKEHGSVASFEIGNVSGGAGLSIPLETFWHVGSAWGYISRHETEPKQIVLTTGD